MIGCMIAVICMVDINLLMLSFGKCFLAFPWSGMQDFVLKVEQLMQYEDYSVYDFHSCL